jgi:hypothetical protein
MTRIVKMAYALAGGCMLGSMLCPTMMLAATMTPPTAMIRPMAKAAQCCLFVSVANAGSQSELVALDRNQPYDEMGTVAPEPGGYPWFLAVSGRGTLYVGDPLTSAVYAYGNGFSQPPTRTYPQAGDPWRLAVGPDNTLYVAVSVGSGSSSYVIEYPKGRKKPGQMLSGPSDFLGLSLAVDRSSNVYLVSQSKSSGAIQIITYPAGSSSGTVNTLETDGAGLLAGGLAVDDAGNVLVGLVDGNMCPRAYVYPPGQTSPSGSLGPPAHSEYCGNLTNVRSLSLFRKRLYMGVLYGPSNVLQLSYPKGRLIGGWHGPPSLFYTLDTAVGTARPS